MLKEEYELMYKEEDTHWWYAGKRNLILKLFARSFPQKDRLKILDVGCGTGVILKALQNYGEVHGIDISAEAIRFCKQRGIKNIKKGSVMRLPFKSNTFDAVGCFDVLYHKAIRDDVVALKELYRVCKPGGKILITDSAMKCLWSQHDIATQARTRYSKKEMQMKVEGAGFIVEKISYYNTILFPLIFIYRKIFDQPKDTKNAQSNIKETPALINTVLKDILFLEAILLKIVNFPVGVSIVCVARKTSLAPAAKQADL